MTEFADLPPDAQRLSAMARVARTPLPAGGEMVWRVWGEGESLLLVHGGAGSWLHWLRTINHFSDRGWQVVVPDLQGFGESSALADGYSIEMAAELAVAGLRQVADAPQYRLVGFSFGGVMAGQMAEILGSATGHLVICGAGGMGLARPAMQELVKWRHLPIADQRAVHRRNLEILMFGDPARIDEDAISIQARNAERARGASRSFSRTDTLLRALRRARPVLDGIWGEKDATARGMLDAHEILLREIDSEARLIRIPGAGHWVQYEAAEAFNASLDYLLAHRSASVGA